MTSSNPDAPIPPSPLASGSCNQGRPQRDPSLTLPTRAAAQMTPSLLSCGSQTTSNKSPAPPPRPANPSLKPPAETLHLSTGQAPWPNFPQPGEPLSPSVPDQPTTPLSPPDTGRLTGQDHQARQIPSPELTNFTNEPSPAWELLPLPPNSFPHRSTSAPLPGPDRPTLPALP